MTRTRPTADQILGLRRLFEVLLNPPVHKEQVSAIERRRLLCLAWKADDTPEQVLRRHPRIADDVEHLKRRMREIRPLLGVPKGRHLEPSRIAELYLQRLEERKAA